MQTQTQNNTNATQDNNALVGRFVQDDDFLGHISEYKRGWYTVVDSKGTEAKMRKADVESALLPDGFEPSDEDNAPAQSMSKQLQRYREGYVPSISASGRKSLSNGDDVAQALEAKDASELYEVVEAVFGLDLRERYESLNAGSQRMNLGNRIRAAFRNEDHDKHDAVAEWVANELA